MAQQEWTAAQKARYLTPDNAADLRHEARITSLEKEVADLRRQLAEAQASVRAIPVGETSIHPDSEFLKSLRDGANPN